MLSCVGVLAGGCQTDGQGTAPAVECRGRVPILLSAPVIAAMSRAQLEQVVASNEALERECGVRAPNPTGRARGAG